MPCLRVPLGCKRLFEIGVIGKKVSAQSVRDGLAARFVDQLGVSFVSESISGCSCDGSGVKVVVGQLEPAFLLRKEQSSIVVQGFVEAAHIQLFHSRCGWMKREATERAYLRNKAQEQCLEASKEVALFIDIAPILAIRRIRDVIDELRLGLARIALLNFIFF
jgi:hypothetical protein